MNNYVKSLVCVLMVYVSLPLACMNRVTEQLYPAIKNGYFATVESVISRMSPAQFNASDIGDEDGKKALHWFACDKSLAPWYNKISKKLIEKGADPLVKTRRKENCPIHYAAIVGSLDMVKMYVRHNAECLVVNNIDGVTPFHCAVISGSKPLVKYFLDQGVNQRDETITGEWPMTYALNAIIEKSKLISALGSLTARKKKSTAQDLQESYDIVNILVEADEEIGQQEICYNGVMMSISEYAEKNMRRQEKT